MERQREGGRGASYQYVVPKLWRTSLALWPEYGIINKAAVDINNHWLSTVVAATCFIQYSGLTFSLQASLVIFISISFCVFVPIQ